jgi:hypothetical protein
LLEQVIAAFPADPAIVVICDNDPIHRARAVRVWVPKTYATRRYS